MQGDTIHMLYNTWMWGYHTCTVVECGGYGTCTVLLCGGIQYMYSSWMWGRYGTCIVVECGGIGTCTVVECGEIRYLYYVLVLCIDVKCEYEECTIRTGDENYCEKWTTHLIVWLLIYSQHIMLMKSVTFNIFHRFILYFKKNNNLISWEILKFFTCMTSVLEHVGSWLIFGGSHIKVTGHQRV